MYYTSFSRIKNDPLTEPMFLGNPVNISRYDQQRYLRFENLIEQQLSFFWRPEEIDLNKDRIDFQSLQQHEKHIFLSNLKYQTLLDSIQGRSPNVAFLPLVSLPELETWITTWTFSETIHSRSYTHIIRNLLSDPSKVFEEIIETKEILDRANDISYYYDDLMKLCFKFQTQSGKDSPKLRRDIKKSLYLCMVSVNVLEAIRFYVSFACAFAFAEREKMEGNAKIIKLIARDESLHLSGTQYIISLWHSGIDDPEMAEIADICRSQAKDIFLSASQQEKNWANYLFNQGSMLGLNEVILSQYVDYITFLRMKAIGLSDTYTKIIPNPIPWINHWLASDNVQVAPQESEISSYLVGQVDANIDYDDFSNISL